MGGRTLRRILPSSPTHPPLVEVTLEEASHAWPNWQLFSPPLRQGAYALHKSTTDADSTVCATPFESGKALQAPDMENEGENGRGDSLRGDRRHPPKRRGPQVSAVALLAFVMCFGVFLVGIFGFLPIYFIGFRDVSAAVQMAQTQAVASMVASASTSMSRLPNIIKFVLAAYMSSVEAVLLCTCPDEVKTLFFLANVMSQERYRDFLTIVSVVHTVPQHEWVIGVTTSLKNVTLAATVATAEEPTRLYAIDDKTHFFKSPREVMMDLGMRVKEYVRIRNNSIPSDAAAEAAGERFRFEQAGLGSAMEISVPTGIWVPWNHTFRFSYFNVLFPLNLKSEDGVCTSFVEGGLRSAYIAGIVRDHFRYAIRQHGCYIMVDLARDLVLVNSWNQSSLGRESADMEYIPFRVSAIEHPLMRAAVDFLERQGGLRTVAQKITDLQNEARSFRFKGKTVILRVSPIRAPYGLDLMFVSVTIQSDFFASIDRTLSALTYTMVAAIVTTAVVSYVVAVYLRRTIQQLSAALRASSKLQFTTEVGSSCYSRLHIVELEDVEAAYGRVQQQLMTLKTVLPCSLLITEEEALATDAEDDGETIGESRNGRRPFCSYNGASALRSDNEAPSEGAPQRGAADSVNSSGDSSGRGSSGSIRSGSSSDHNNESNMSSANAAGDEPINQLSSRLSRRWQQNVVLNTKVFNEKTNVFRKRYCTIVWICHYYTVGIEEAVLDLFFKVVYGAVMEFKGCLQSLRPDYVVVTFNAHTPLPMHAKLGCEMALAIRKRMPPSATGFLTTLVDTSNFLVGTCGSENGLKSRTIVDVMHLSKIDRVLREKGYHQVVVTQSTAKHLEYHETVPLDVVLIPFHEAPYTLYELRDASSGSIAERQQTAQLFRSGFQRMRVGDYVNALRSFIRVAPSDVAAQRLKLLCMKNICEGRKNHYMCRVRLPKLRILSRIMHLRSTFNMHLLAMCLWRQSQVDGIFALGPFTRKLASEAGDAAARDGRECGTSSRDERRVGGDNDGFSATPLTRVSSLTTRSPDHVGRQWGAEATEVSSRSNVLSSDEQEGALIEWISFHSASDTDDTDDVDEMTPTRGVASPTAAADSIPLCVLDSNGEKWNRALKADHAGHASIVYQAMADDGVQVAIKFLPKKNRSMPEARLYNEIMVMSKLKHLNIVQYISYVWTTTHIGIVMEYAPGGSLRDTIDGFGALPESLVRRYMVDILHGLAYLHRGGITHGDVKPHNILLGADGVCKLSDFGSTVCEAADLARSNGMLEFRGTAVYTSPEVAAGQLPTTASDIYSLGISFLEMLMGRLPWRWADPRLHAKRGDCITVREVAFVQSVGRGEIKPVISKHLSTAAQEFAEACCRTAPGERPTVSELLSFRFVL